MKKLLLLTTCILFVFSKANANGIAISNLTSVVSGDYVQLEFDITWDNSWRTTTNWDAAWVFFKWKDNDGTWRHLNLTNANNTISAGYTLAVPADLTGAMIFRSATGFGTVTLADVRVGVTNFPGAFDIKAFGIEMTNIPVADAFYAGDGTASASSSYRSAATTSAFLVNSNTITMGTGSGQMNDQIGNGSFATGFPVGYNSTGVIYMMKHEISQGAYRDFLNTLSYTQQVTRTLSTAPPSSSAGTQVLGLLSRRSSLQIKTAGVSATTPAVYGCNMDNNGVFDDVTDGEWVPCGYLLWADVAAYLDWASLRPMTELEFEKACRGTNAAVTGEYCFGSTAFANPGSAWTVNNQDKVNETVTYSGSVLNGNMTWNGVSPGSNKPLRVGIHATTGATRVSSGAGFYGNLDLSGNITEQVVTTGNTAGRSFTGLCGNGALNANGEADVDFWPGINGNTTTTTANTAYGGTTGINIASGTTASCAGATFRGGNCGSGASGGVVSSCQTSFRPSPAGTITRNAADGGRGIKSF